MNLKKFFLFFILLLCCMCQINCYKILCVFPTPAKSHWLIGSSIAKTLATAGNDVTMISSYALKPPMKNHRDIVVSNLTSVSEEKVKEYNMLAMTRLPVAGLLYILYTMGAKVSTITLNSPNVRLLYKEKFDLVIVQSSCLDSLLGFGQLFNCPVITAATFGASKWTNDLVGTPAPLSYVPHSFLSYTDEMNFFQRFVNGLTTILENVFMELYYMPIQKKIYENGFPDPKPSFEKIYKSVSLTFVNSHFTLSFAKPLLPNLIEIGGIQIEKNLKPLPKNLQNFLDSAENGVIYFSMGSNLKGIDFPPEKQQAFIEAFRKFEGKVIWKFENENLPNKPDNVLISAWLPQNEILAHPNVKLFITHGGLLGCTESVYNGLPIIGIPIYGDQELNIARAELAKWGLKLDYKNISESSITYAIQKVLTNPSFTENAKTISFRYRDQPMTPAQTLIYWVEYVIRHKGAPHLQSAGQKLNFIQYHMLDVYFVMLLFVIFGTILSIFILKTIFKKCFKKTNNEKLKKQN